MKIAQVGARLLLAGEIVERLRPDMRVEHILLMLGDETMRVSSVIAGYQGRSCMCMESRSKSLTCAGRRRIWQPPRSYFVDTPGHLRPIGEPPCATAETDECKPTHAIEWAISDAPVAYPAALATMEARVAAIADGRARELVWLLEHPSLYTAGTSAKVADLVSPDRFPVFDAGRGGQYTYHGPGQRVAYVMLDVKRAFWRRARVRHRPRNLDHRCVGRLQCARRNPTRPGRRLGASAGVGQGKREDKVAAIGIRLRRWISFHGLSINVEPDLEHFSGIVPCGIREHGVTSLVDLGLPVTMADLDVALKAAFERRMGPTTAVAAPPTSAV